MLAEHRRMLHRVMRLSRRLDDAEIGLRRTNEAFFHIPSAGCEAVQAAVGTLLEPARDWCVSYYRDRALMLALGMTADEMMLAAVGSAEDPGSAGRQIPSNWSSPRLNVASRSSCQGTQFHQACGLARAARPGELVYVSAGEGTCAQGELWEALETMVREHLPMLVLVQDNGYAISTPSSVQYPGGDIAALLAGYRGLTIASLDGTDPEACLAALTPLVAAIRAGGNPVLVRATVTRPYGHSISDDQSKYRSSADLDAERTRDGLTRYEARLVAEGVLTRAALAEVHRAVDDEVDRAVARARASRRPAPESALEHLYADEAASRAGAGVRAAGTADSRAGAGARAAGTADSRAGASGSAAETTASRAGAVADTGAGMRARPGAVVHLAVSDCPIGQACGLAMRGVRPVLALDGVGDLWRAMMHVKNELATTRYRTAGTFVSPVVLRVPVDADGAEGEALFVSVPGLRVFAPSTLADAQGLMASALTCGDPVIFLEPRGAFPDRWAEQVSASTPRIAPGQLARVRGGSAGRDARGAVAAVATLVTWGVLVTPAGAAVEELAQRGVGVDLLDLRTLAPWDADGVVAAVRATGRALVAEADLVLSGFGAEVAAVIGERCFAELLAPVQRLGARDGYPLARPGARGTRAPGVAELVAALVALIGAGAAP